MWSATDKVMTYDQAKADANKAKKDMKMVHTHTGSFTIEFMYYGAHNHTFIHVHGLTTQNG